MQKMATNDELARALDNYNDHVHQVAKTFLHKIDELFSEGKYQVIGKNRISFYSFSIEDHEPNSDLIAKAMKEFRDYEEVQVNIRSTGDEYSWSNGFEAQISVIPKL